MNLSFVAFVAVVLVVVIGVGIVGYYAQQRRRKAFAAWAAQHGFSYAPSDDRYADLPWGHPFGEGFGRAALDVLESTDAERPVLCFTYRYKTRSRSSNGKTTTTQNHWFSIYSARLPKPLPELRVGREGVFGRLARAVGFHDIEFESEEFNRQFKVQADDRKFASDVVDPQMMQFLMSGRAPGFTIVGADVVLVHGGKLDLPTVLPTLDYLAAVIARIPGFVWKAH